MVERDGSDAGSKIVTISLIVAVAANGVIGANNRMPWHLPSDLRRFRELTWGKPIVMGRRTHEAIGRPLPGRENLILTHDRNWSATGCRTVHSIEEATGWTVDAELMVVGGAEIYRQFFPLSRRIYLTEIHQDFPGDIRFPAFDRSNYTETVRQELIDQASGLAYRFVILDRN